MSMLPHLASVERLKGRDNYDSWKMSAEAALELTDLWQYVTGDVTETDDAKKLIGERQAKAKLTLMVDPINYSHIRSCTTAKEIWDALGKAFNDDGLMRCWGLMRTITNTRLENCASMEQYVDTIMTTANKMTHTGLEVTDQWLSIFLLAGLSDDYKPMILAMDSTGAKITADYVKTKLLQHSSIETPSNDTNALYSRNNSNRGKNNSGGGYSNGNSSNGKNNNSKRNDMNCYGCGKQGHIKRNCPEKRDESEVTSLFCMAAKQLSKSNDVFVDSGASTHMFNDERWFTRQRPGKADSVCVANNSEIDVRFTGTTKLSCNRGDQCDMDVNLEDSICVPDLCTNLLSVYQLDERGCKIVFQNKMCHIYRKDGVLIGRAPAVNRMYKLELNPRRMAKPIVRAFVADRHRQRDHKDRKRKSKFSGGDENKSFSQVNLNLNNGQFYIEVDDMASDGTGAAKQADDLISSIGGQNRDATSEKEHDSADDVANDDVATNVNKRMDIKAL